MASYLQDEETGKFIERSEWIKKWGAVKYHSKGSSKIMSDIKPFVSPIDGSIINSRPQLNAHNDKHGVTNIKDYDAGHFEKRGKEMQLEATGQTAEAKHERKQLLDKTLNDFGV